LIGAPHFTEFGKPPLVFIACKPNRDGSPCWRIEGRTVADLWRAIDAISPALQLREAESRPINPRHDLTDEQLLGVIAEGGATWMIWALGSNRLLESGETL
jgi:hypothetical protein